MKFYILKESPVNSGQYVETGECIDDSAEVAAHHCADQTAITGVKHGMHVFDPVRRNIAGMLTPPTIETPAADTDEAEAA